MVGVCVLAVWKNLAQRISNREFMQWTIHQATELIGTAVHDYMQHSHKMESPAVISWQL